MTALGTPRCQWPMLLMATGGALPTTIPQFRALLEYIRRQGHMNDRGIDPVKSLGFVAWDVDGTQTPVGSASHDSWAYHGHQQTQSEPAHSHTASESWDDDVSSGHSQHEELDFSDCVGMSDNEVGESLYLAYAFAKQRWRRFTGGSKGSKHRKGSGKKGFKGRKGPFGKHYNQAPKAYTTEDYSQDQWEAATLDPWSGTAEEYQYQQSFKSRSKGKSRRGNPLGRDGKPLTCRVCNSTDHFAASCPQGSGKGSSGKSSFMTEVMQQNQAATDQQPHGFFAQTAPLSGSVSALFASAQAAGSRIIYDDGTFECLQPSQTPGDPPKRFPASELRGTPGSAPKKVSFGLVNFMWFEPTLLYHSSVKLPSGKEGLFGRLWGRGQPCW